MVECDFEIKENRWAHVNEKNIVVNIIEWDGKKEIMGYPPKGHKLVKCSKFVSANDTYAPIENVFLKSDYILK